MITLYEGSELETAVFENESSLHDNIRQLMKHDSICWVSNVTTQMAAIVYQENIWPFTINHTEYSNALICSPYTTYVTYPLDELKKFDKKWVKTLVLLNVAIMTVLCRLTQFNRVIQINNNLNSLIKHPKKLARSIPSITKKIIDKYPHHAITLFRVNDALDQTLLHTLTQEGYWVFPDRAAHVFFPEQSFMKRSHTKRDMSLLRKTEYDIVPHDDLKPEDADRIAELYQRLFIQKHSHCNPIYTPDYFRMAITHRWHQYTALRNREGVIDAFISWFESESVMSCGPLGYDSDIDQKMGLYRQLVALCLKHAHDHSMIFNMGGGSDEFKSNRGSTQTLEFTAVYCHHLSWYRKIPWKILHWACNRFLKKIVDNSSL